MAFRDRMKRNPYGSLIWRVFIGAIGGLTTLVGVIMLVAPGPGILVLLTGLGILATEFAWASSALLKTREMAKSATERVGLPLWVKYALAAGTSIIALISLAVIFAK